MEAQISMHALILINWVVVVVLGIHNYLLYSSK